MGLNRVLTWPAPQLLYTTCGMCRLPKHTTCCGLHWVRGKYQQPVRSTKTAEVFPPHEYVAEEMEARGWRIEDLAEQAGWSLALTSEVVSGKHRITKLIAYGLAQAFGTSMALWLNLGRHIDG